MVELRDGPELIFGDATHVRAKWIAATRVLADPEAAGATYIDVRLPGRPAAGGLPAATLAPVAPAGTRSSRAPGRRAAGPRASIRRPSSSPRRPAARAQAAPSGDAKLRRPTTPEPAPAPADTTGAGGVSPPPG